MLNAVICCDDFKTERFKFHCLSFNKKDNVIVPRIVNLKLKHVHIIYPVYFGLFYLYMYIDVSRHNSLTVFFRFFFKFIGKTIKKYLFQLWEMQQLWDFLSTQAFLSEARTRSLILLRFLFIDNIKQYLIRRKIWNNCGQGRWVDHAFLFNIFFV